MSFKLFLKVHVIRQCLSKFSLINFLGRVYFMIQEKKVFAPDDFLSGNTGSD